MEKIYLSGYTHEDNRGIHLASFDQQTGLFKDSRLIIEADNPTYMDFSADGQSLFALAEIDGQGGAIHYREEDGEYRLVDQTIVWEKNSCYISYDEERSLVYLANYDLGKLAVVKVGEDGSLEPIQIIDHTDETGPHENQDAPHAHYIRASQQTNFVFSCNLGTDQVHTYVVGEDSKLNERSVYQAEPGTGPRHLVEHPTYPILYILGELTYTIDIVKIEEDGALTRLDRVKTMPDSWDSFNSSAAIRITEAGDFLYVSNRGSNQITGYSIQNEGQSLKEVQTISSGADFPRDFNFNATEDYIICGHQHDPVISVFERNTETGRLTRVEDSLQLNEIVCVQ